MIKLTPYYIISATSVFAAFVVGGALSSAADIIHDKAYIQGQSDMVRSLPINYLAEIEV